MPALDCDAEVKITDRELEGAVGKNVKKLTQIPELGKRQTNYTIKRNIM
jgi:hypothetical protein